MEEIIGSFENEIYEIWKRFKTQNAKFQEVYNQSLGNI